MYIQIYLSTDRNGHLPVYRQVERTADDSDFCLLSCYGIHLSLFIFFFLAFIPVLDRTIVAHYS